MSICSRGRKTEDIRGIRLRSVRLLSGLCSHFLLDLFRPMDYIEPALKLGASSSAGRAPRSQCGGRGFDPLLVHQFYRLRSFNQNVHCTIHNPLCLAILFRSKPIVKKTLPCKYLYSILFFGRPFSKRKRYFPDSSSPSQFLTTLSDLIINYRAIYNATRATTSLKRCS